MVEHRSEKPGVDSSILSLGISLSLLTHKNTPKNAGECFLLHPAPSAGFPDITKNPASYRRGVFIA